MRERATSPGPLFEWMHAQLAALARRAGYQIPAPAAETELAEAEARLGSGLPPAYRRFLALQNGWPQAWRGMSLLPAGELAQQGCWLIIARRAADDRGEGAAASLAFEIAPPVEEPPLVCHDVTGVELERFASFQLWLRQFIAEGTG